MKHLYSIIAVLTIALTLASCGEDRTYQYEEKTQHNQWMLDLMSDKYLWADSLASYEPAWKDFFATPADFMAKLAGRSKQNDKWSYVLIDTLNTDIHQRGYYNHYDSYGMDFVLVTDPTGRTTRQYARIITVYDGSPAHEAGLRRGDYIYSYNSYKLSSNNIARLQKGPARDLEICHLSINEETDEYYWESILKLPLPASRYVEDKAFLIYNNPNYPICLPGTDAEVGYLKCNRLVEAPYEKGAGKYKGTEYIEQLDSVMHTLMQKNIKELILDLSLCNDGNLTMAQRLASYIVAPEYRNTPFVKTFWNERYKSKNVSLLYNSSKGNLGLSRVYIITSKYTQGAAEWLIHSLQTTMGEDNVILIGEPTAGQNVMTEEIGYDYHVHACPAVAYVADANGDYNYGSLSPIGDYIINELDFFTLGQYGSENNIFVQIAYYDMLFGRQNVTEEDENNKEN